MSVGSVPWGERELGVAGISGILLIFWVLQEAEEVELVFYLFDRALEFVS